MRVAQARVQLMAYLGYERYGVHSTDAGGGVAGMLAALEPQRVAGFISPDDSGDAARSGLELDGLASLRS